MKYPSINLSGNIISGDILDKIQSSDNNLRGQSLKDFGLEQGPLKEEINTAYALAKSQWQIFQTKLKRLDESSRGTTETRTLWMIPLLGFLGYELESKNKAEEIQGKKYAISHRAANRGNFPIHLVSIKDSLDSKPQQGGSRMSPHAMLQEFLNLHEHLYALLSNGKVIRLLRDSSRLVKLTYLEFDLEQMMEEDHTADFALMYRLLHVSRMPTHEEAGDSSLIEQYHQEALISGSRIREGLSQSVELSLQELGLGFIQEPANQVLREAMLREDIDAKTYYQELLRLIYRLLFLFVIEERNLVYGKTAQARQREIYYQYYSLSRLRALSEKRYLADQAHKDLWIALRQTFRLYEQDRYGSPLGIQALAGDLFGKGTTPWLQNCELRNEILLKVLKQLNQYRDRETGQYSRVNYAALNVEEFGSVYENLLEKEPKLSIPDELNSPPSLYLFELIKGDERSSSGSHYTPDELVKPLIQHSLDHLIEEKLALPASIRKESSTEELRQLQAQALLSLKVCDVACGSGHILLAAARRIGLALARVRTGDDQPAPEPLRAAIREVIQQCIYGVDKNPLAVELCKVALWLEAHNPGEPLNFLDHHIKCGDAIVGLARPEELERGIANEAFKKLERDDKEVAKEFRDKNKKQRRERGKLAQSIAMQGQLGQSLGELMQQLREVVEMPERNPEEITQKAVAYTDMLDSEACRQIRNLCDLQSAAFFIPKTETYRYKLLTDGSYLKLLKGLALEEDYVEALEEAESQSRKQKFFHWFLEFPEVFLKAARTKPQENGQLSLSMAAREVISSEGKGFDCVLGNPPFLGGQKLSGVFGKDFTEWLKYQYAPIGSCDLVTYFFRRIYHIIREKGFQSLISTNTIAQGGAREGGLAVMKDQGASINHAVRSMKWPGRAAVEVALLSIYKGEWEKTYILDHKKVERITSYLDDMEDLGEPYRLAANAHQSFQGSIVLGKGFVLEPEKALSLVCRNPKNAEVIYPYLNGDDLNSAPDAMPSRFVINFKDWPLRRYTPAEWDALPADEQEQIEARAAEGKSLVAAPPEYKEPVATDYEDCLGILEERVKAERLALAKEKIKKGKTPTKDDEVAGKFWWQFLRFRPALYRSIAPLERVLVVPRVTKTHAFSILSNDYVYSEATTVFAIPKFDYFLLLQSSLHCEWAWLYSSTMKGDRRYSPSNCFENFPFFRNSSEYLTNAGAKFHSWSNFLTSALQLGLTSLYNQFHNSSLRPTSQAAWAGPSEAHALAETLSQLNQKQITKEYGKETWNLVKHIDKIQGTSFRSRDPHRILTGEADIYNPEIEPVPAASLAEAIHGIWELRCMHVEMDEAVLAAYGWHEAHATALKGGRDASGLAQSYKDPTYTKAIQLRHGFYEVDYLPENDRTRFTIHPEARKEVLKRLLLLNHARYHEEVLEGKHGK